MKRLSISILAIFIVATSARVLLLKSASPSTTLRQSSTGGPFSSFLELNRRTQARTRSAGFNPLQIECLSQKYQTLSGVCNNRRQPSIGAAETPFHIIARTVDFDFDKLPNARFISNVICEEASPTRNSRGMSELVTFFGQFIDHTVTETSVDANKPLNINIPLDDPVFKADQSIPFLRSITKGTGKNRSPLNRLSSYIDAASVYSVEGNLAMKLRSMKGGRMKLPGGLLQVNKDGFFISGDQRVNENPNLTALHLLFTREHNKIAAVVEKAFPTYDDEQIYQMARKVLIAEMQEIVFYEWLPTLAGRYLPRYKDYKEGTNSGISNTFSTVAFRVGHSLLNSSVTSISASGIVTRRLLRDSFFNPKAFRDSTIEGLLRGMISGFAAEVDAGITGEVRNFLVDSGSPQQLDLAALNIQRGRDHGVPLYNDLRTYYGLPRLSRFDQITSNLNLQFKLEHVYKGDINSVDAWVGGVSEDRVVGSFGPLFARIWLREFKRLRDGDRYYFERKGIFSASEITKIPMLANILGPSRKLGTVMRDIIIRNTNIPATKVQSNPFFV